MVCEKCGSYNIYVIETRTTTNNVLRRRRKCDCGNKWTTYEVSASEIKRINKINEHFKKINEQMGG